MRGRDAASPEPGANALAQRFMAQDEPDTIDLVERHGFQTVSAEEEPDTRASASSPAEDAAGDEKHALISLDGGSGKFYVHPGQEEATVRLNDEPVTSRTELRKGDRIRIGTVEFEFSEAVKLP